LSHKLVSIRFESSKEAKPNPVIPREREREREKMEEEEKTWMLVSGLRCKIEEKGKVGDSPSYSPLVSTVYSTA